MFFRRKPKVILTPEILTEITDNPEFEAIFLERVLNPKYMKAFNSTANFKVEVVSSTPDLKGYLKDQSQGIKGIKVQPKKLEQFVNFIYQTSYLPEIRKKTQ